MFYNLVAWYDMARMKPASKVTKLCFMLNSAELEIYPTQMLTPIVGILTKMSMII